MSTAHFILQGKGGVGKSVIASLLYQYFDYKGVDVLAIDTDPENHSLAGYKSFNVELHDILLDGKTIDQQKWDALIDKICDDVPQNAHVIIDNGASSFLALKDYILQNDVAGILKDEGVTPYFHAVITGGAALVDITPDVKNLIGEAIIGRKNMLVVGGTSSGKTTFCNGIIRYMDELCPNDRILILEDTKELQSQSSNLVQFLTSGKAGVGLRELTKVCMRYAPKRIHVGEVRDGAALEMLKLWNTGHPGGIGTLHADSALEALERVGELVEEAGVGPKEPLIGRAIDLILFMAKLPDNTRALKEIVRVNGYNKKTKEFDTEYVYRREA